MGTNFKLHRGRCGGRHVVPSLQVSGISPEQLLVFLYPGLPTTAELFILPDKPTSSLHKKSSEEALETVRTQTRGHLSRFSLVSRGLLLPVKRQDNFVPSNFSGNDLKILDFLNAETFSTRVDVF